MDMDKIHALGAAVSMATGGAQSIQGGNWRIFDAMLDEARVTRRLGFEVSSCRRHWVDEGRLMISGGGYCPSTLYQQIPRRHQRQCG